MTEGRTRSKGMDGAATEADLQEFLLAVEAAMNAEGVDGRAIWRVINRLVYGEPHGPTHRYGGLDDERRIVFMQRALAQAKVHQHALDRLQSDLREAGEAYAYSSALAVRDAAMGLVRQLRNDLGDKDPDLIVGEIVDANAEHPQSRARPELIEATFQAPDEDWYARALHALEITRPPLTPFRNGLPATRPRIDAPCYQASFGPVHYSGCDCRR